MKSGEIPRPPRPSGLLLYSAQMGEVVPLVKTGGRVTDLTPEKQNLYRAYNRENQRRVEARRRDALGP